MWQHSDDGLGLVNQALGDLEAAERIYQTASRLIANREASSRGALNYGRMLRDAARYGKTSQRRRRTKTWPKATAALRVRALSPLLATHTPMRDTVMKITVTLPGGRSEVFASEGKNKNKSSARPWRSQRTMKMGARGGCVAKFYGPAARQ